MRLGDINECDTLIVYNEMCQRLEDLHSSVDQYFQTNAKCYKIMHEERNPFKVQGGPMGFNISTKVHWCGFRFHSTIKKYPQAGFWCSIRGEYLQLSKKTIKTFLPFPST